jgi:hypothetical protein
MLLGEGAGVLAKEFLQRMTNCLLGTVLQSGIDQLIQLRRDLIRQFQFKRLHD